MYSSALRSRPAICVRVNGVGSLVTFWWNWQTIGTGGTWVVQTERERRVRVKIVVSTRH